MPCVDKNGVNTKAGATALTRIPKGASCKDNEREKAVTNALVGPLKEGSNCLAEPETRVDVGVDLPIKLPVGQISDVHCDVGVGRIADEDVQSAEMFSRSVHKVNAKGLSTQVSWDGEDSSRRGCFNHRHNFLGVRLFFWEIADDHVGTFARICIATARTIPESPPVVKPRRPTNRPVPSYLSSPQSGRISKLLINPGNGWTGMV